MSSQYHEYQKEKAAFKQRETNNKIMIGVFSVLFLVCCGGGFWFAKSKPQISNVNDIDNNSIHHYSTKQQYSEQNENEDHSETQNKPHQTHDDSSEPKTVEAKPKSKFTVGEARPKSKFTVGEAKPKSKFTVGESIKLSSSKTDKRVAEVHTRACRDDLEHSGISHRQCLRVCSIHQREDEKYSSCMMGCEKAGRGGIAQGCQAEVEPAICASENIKKCDSYCDDLPSAYCTKGCQEVSHATCEQAISTLKTVLTSASSAGEL